MVATFKHITVLCFFLSSIFLRAQVEINETKVEAFKVFDTEDGFPAVSLRAGFTQDSLGFIWLASHIGLYRFDGYHVKSFHSNPEDSSSLHDSYVSRFMATQAGKQLIGSAYQGIAEYIPETNAFKQWTPIISANKFGNIRKLLEDRQGYVWAVSSRGLHKFDPIDKSVRRIDISSENLTSSQAYRKHTSFYDLVIDPKKDQLWLAGRFGLFRFDIKTEQYEWFFNEKFYDQANSPQPRMTGIAFDEKRNCIWVISRGNGVFQFLPETKQWINKMAKNRYEKETFNIADGIQNFEDEILLSGIGRKGALFYNKDQHTLENIIFQKGNEARKFTFSCFASFIDNNGYLISVYESGVVRSSFPIRPVEKINIPNIALTKIEWQKEKLDSLNPVFLKTLSIEKAPEILRLNYVAINPPNPNSTFYKYRLKGHDKDWVDNGQSLEALYSNLNKGNYQFEVWAQDTTLRWENKVNLLNIEVYQVWWKNSWLYIIYSKVDKKKNKFNI
jgi:frataxin-like iron-binding protein CyaY